MKILEPLDHETLNFEPDHYEKNISNQNVCVACVEKGFVSTAFMKYYFDYRLNFMHMVFTIEELDVFIRGLQEAKERALNFREDELE